jgi:hypothetical protein
LPWKKRRNKSETGRHFFHQCPELNHAPKVKFRDLFLLYGISTQQNERSPYRQTAAKKENVNTGRITIGKSWLMQRSERRPGNMQVIISPQPIVALIAGISILLFPRLLNYIVAIYLIVFGILGLVR